MKLCEFGCGQKASHQFKNSKWCCTKSSSSCPAMRLKNSSAKAGINPWADREHPRGMLGRVPWNFGKTLETDATIAKAAKRTRRTKAENPDRRGFRKGYAHDESTKARISKTMKL